MPGCLLLLSAMEASATGALAASTSSSSMGYDALWADNSSNIVFIGVWFELERSCCNTLLCGQDGQDVIVSKWICSLR